MIIIDDTLVSDEIFDVYFICDLPACSGTCCVEGDAGAPLEEEEVGIMEDVLDIVKPYMTPEGKANVEKNGVFVLDDDGQFVTPLNDGKECSFVFFENGEARCAIEKAWSEKKISFRKPISCHLYPIRLASFSDKVAVNYHDWPICAPARVFGRKEGVRVYQFLKEPLIRKFGAEWYTKLEMAAEYYLNTSRH